MRNFGTGEHSPASMKRREAVQLQQLALNMSLKASSTCLLHSTCSGKIHWIPPDKVQYCQECFAASIACRCIHRALSGTNVRRSSWLCLEFILPQRHLSHLCRLLTNYGEHEHGFPCSVHNGLPASALHGTRSYETLHYNINHCTLSPLNTGWTGATSASWLGACLDAAWTGRARHSRSSNPAARAP